MNNKQNNLLYYFTFVVVLVSQFSTTQTLWVFFTKMGIALRLVSILLLLILFVQSVTKYSGKQLISISILSVLFLVVAWNTGYYHGFLLCSTFVLVIGAKGVQFRNIVKFHLLIIVCLFLVNLLAYSMDWIDKSLIFTGDQRENMFADDIIVRFSGGYPASTDLATHLLYMLLDVWILKRRENNYWWYLLCMITFSFVAFYCDARQAALCVLLVLLFSLYSTSLFKGKKINFLFKWILIYCVSIFFFVSLLSTLLYDETDLLWVGTDILLSGRLHYGLDAIQEYGFSFFGQDILFVGGGFSGGTLEYNYVDNAYVQFLLRWGWIVMAVFLMAYIQTCKNALKNRDYVLLFAIFVAGASSLITQFLFYLHYSVLILALCAIHSQMGITNKCVDKI